MKTFFCILSCLPFHNWVMHILLRYRWYRINIDSHIYTTESIKSSLICTRHFLKKFSIDADNIVAIKVIFNRKISSFIHYKESLLFYLGFDIDNIVSISMFLSSQLKPSILYVDIIDIVTISIRISTLRNQLYWTFVQDLSIIFVDTVDIDFI